VCHSRRVDCHTLNCPRRWQTGEQKRKELLERASHWFRWGSERRDFGAARQAGDLAIVAYVAAVFSGSCIDEVVPAVVALVEKGEAESAGDEP
jgi:hypothetical protein